MQRHVRFVPQAASCTAANSNDLFGAFDPHIGFAALRLEVDRLVSSVSAPFPPSWPHLHSGNRTHANCPQTKIQILSHTLLGKDRCTSMVERRIPVRCGTVEIAVLHSLIPKFPGPPFKQNGQRISETKPVLQSMGALQQYVLAWLASGHSHSDRLLFRSSAPIGIYIDGLKHFAQRDQRRTIELRANGNVKDRNSVSRQCSLTSV